SASNGARTNSARDVLQRARSWLLVSEADRSGLFRFFLFLGRRDLHLHLREDRGIQLEQLEGARRRDALATLETVGHLHLAAIADADGDLAAVRCVVLVDHDGE